MLASIHGAEFYVPDELVADYIVQFLPLKHIEHRGYLNGLRDDILDTFETVMYDPEALYEPEFLEEFIETLAMRQALIEIKILHDA